MANPWKSESELGAVGALLRTIGHHHMADDAAAALKHTRCTQTHTHAADKKLKDLPSNSLLLANSQYPAARKSIISGLPHVLQLFLIVPHEHSSWPFP